MKRIVCLFVCYALLYVGASDRGRSRKNGIIQVVDGSLGYGLELLLTKLDLIEHNLLKIKNELNEYRSIDKASLFALQNEVLDALHKLETQATPKISKLENGNQERIDATLQKLLQDVGQLQRDCSYHKLTQQLMTGISKQDYSAHSTPKHDCDTPTVQENSITLTAQVSVSDQPSFSSCKDVPSSTSAIYLLRLKNDSVPFEVFCEQQNFGGGWIVIQHWYDGSLDFYRNWNQFRDGFGDLEKEFWLGLEKVYQITNGRAHEMIIELKDFSGNYRYARYDAFEIGNECEQYFLKILGSYNGTAGNSMSYNRGLKFTTADRGSGEGTVQCTTFREGAWWHENDCTRANLNGRYINALNLKSMFWFDFNSYRGLSFSRMMIRELDQSF